jgi:hypothetical protein
MKIVNQIRLFVVTFLWYIKMEEVVTTAVAELRNVFLANNHANRLFVKRFQGTERYLDINFVLCKVTYIGRNRAGKMIIAMGLPTTGQVITARLNLGKTADSITTQARNIKTKITANTWVTFTTLEITTLGTQINTYEDAHGAAKDVAYNVLNATLKSYLVRIQLAADENTTGEQIVIIQSTGCIVQGVGGNHEQVFDGFPGVVSGTIVLIGPAGGQNTFHEWWSSVDGIIWVRLQGTINANTLVSGCVPGAAMYFRHQIINAEGGTGMSDVIVRRAN